MKNIVKTSVLILSCLFILSCSNDFNYLKNENNSSYITFKVSLDTGDRTAFAETANNVEQLSNFILSKQIGYENEEFEVIGTYATYSDLVAAKIEIPFSYKGNESYYTFHISALYGQTLYEGQTTVNIDYTDIVEIPLKRSSLGEGNGSLYYTLDFSHIQGYEAVDSATVNIQSLNTDWTDSFESIFEDPQGSYTYSKDQIPAGYYRIIIRLFSNNESVGMWQELVQIGAGVQTNADRSLEYLNLPQQISFVLCDDESHPAAFETAVDNPLQFTGSISTLPVPVREGYLFTGWYTDESYSETSKVSLPLITSGILYAKWQLLYDNEIVITAENYETVFANFSESTDNLCIYISGDLSTRQAYNDAGGYYYNYEPLNSINAAIPTLLNKLNENSSITIDLTYSTGLQNIGQSSFSNYNTDSVTIILPDSITSIYGNSFPSNLSTLYLGKELRYIEQEAFADCRKLNQIILSPENTAFVLDHGVLINQENGELILYPGNLTEEYFVIPANIYSIYSYAFLSNNNITHLTLGNNVYRLGRMSLCAPNLSSINIPDTNTNFSARHDCLYNSNGTELIRYLGDGNSLTVDSTVSVIYPGAFYNTTLTSVILAGGSDFWRYADWYTIRDNYSSDFDYYAELNGLSQVELSVDNEMNPEAYTNYYLYYFDQSYFQTIVNNSVTVLTYESENLEVNNNNYTISYFTDNPKLYKISINHNKIYKIYWVDMETAESSASEYAYSLPETFVPGKGYFQIFDRQFYKVWINESKTILAKNFYDSENPENNYFYLCVSSWNDPYGQFAFRIVELDAD